MSFSLTLSYLRSLLLASLLSFLAPLTLLGGMIMILLFLGAIPGLTLFGQACTTQMLSFLQTFGNGSALEGAIVIGCACAVVGALFDTYNFTVTTAIDANKPLSE
ncbi:hypothetical protein [Leptolyngbya sp. NIES-2104]|uniref:hypothetical protein n=1 Tax=Leptolyngbya sp. NIES-2104 TaxID=1552121 RepID=UPI0006EC8AAE|nr:hypothetical protein [Leptolyngbya sp. NIES-2104]GAP95456.1 hypothetical protein NIES2104_19780 [Leptolyngbya sp. NIES-2104]